jgi:hypothetical protein
VPEGREKISYIKFNIQSPRHQREHLHRLR